MKTIAALVILTLSLSAQAQRAIPGHVQVKASIGESTELDLSNVEAFNFETSYDLTGYIPTNMQATGDESQVLRKIASRSLKTIAKDQLQNSFIQKTAQVVSGEIKTDIALSQKKERNHNLRVDIKALQAKATLHYQGWMDAKVQYNVSNKKSLFEISQSLDAETKLLVQHSITSDEAKSFLKLDINY